jgi:hypothetical protein
VQIVMICVVTECNGKSDRGVRKSSLLAACREIWTGQQCFLCKKKVLDECKKKVV